MSVAVFVNGKFCKDPKLVKADDFFTYGLNNPGDTTGQIGSNVTTVNVDRIAGLNTLGVSLVRIDFAPYGQNPPHTHPRATEILVVVEGTLYVGFVTSNQDGNRLFTKVLNKGDVGRCVCVPNWSDSLPVQSRKVPSSCLCGSRQPKSRSHTNCKVNLWIQPCHQP